MPSPPLLLTDTQRAELERNPEFKRFQDECPVCRNTGTTKWMGEQIECPDDDYGHVALRLAKLYWLSGIPLEYLRLDWSQWPHKEELADVNEYVRKFEFLRMNGVGMTFYSPGLGTGKTWAATMVLRALVEQGYSGFFVHFKDVKEYEHADFRWLMAKIREAEILVLDDVVLPTTPKMRAFYADHLEGLIRPRLNSCLPTIITTNMTLDELEDEYPRVFSLLYAKNLMLELNGIDGRKTDVVWKQTVDAALNSETAPITSALAQIGDA